MKRIKQHRLTIAITVVVAGVVGAAAYQYSVNKHYGAAIDSLIDTTEILMESVYKK